jgi:hypothetical protein
MLALFRCCLHESGLKVNPDRNVKSIRVYMENGFEDWNLRGKFQFQDGEWCKYHSSSFLFGSFRANTLKQVHDEASDFAKSHLKKRVARKVAMLSYSVAFSFRNEFRFVFTCNWSQISIWIEISIRNEIRIELDPDRVVTHSGLM